ncbi:MAG: class I SAM-dependent methyltransferase [Myxococcota bacterium]
MKATRNTPVPEPYPAALYEAVHSGNHGDVGFYERACKGASSILELGCGWGRIARPLLRLGGRVTGLDVSDDLLSRARVHAPEARFVKGDMRDFDLGERFDRVLIPYNGIYCLLDEQDVIATFRCAAQHLTPDGRLVFDAYAADAFHSEAEPDGDDDERSFVKTVTALGNTWDVYERSRWSRPRQRIDAIYDHVRRDDASQVTSAIPQRYLLREQLPQLLARAGLEVAAIHGGFHGEPADEDAPLTVVFATPRDIA